MRNWQRILAEGIIAGFIGYLTVVVIISATDLLRGRSPFFTAAALGSVLFYGARQTAELVVQPGPVFAYNGVHLTVFLLFGVFMAWLASLSERGPQIWYLAFTFFVMVVPHVIGLPIWFQSAVRETVSVWFMIVATTVAAAVMTLYLWRKHPLIRREMTEDEQ
jgi:hypothetical protein